MKYKLNDHKIGDMCYFGVKECNGSNSIRVGKIKEKYGVWYIVGDNFKVHKKYVYSIEDPIVGIRISDNISARRDYKSPCLYLGHKGYSFKYNEICDIAKYRLYNGSHYIESILGL